MSATIVFVTHNRLQYTMRSMEALLADTESDYELMIWDNGSCDGTLDYLRSLTDPRISELRFVEKNCGAMAAVKYFWQRSKRDFLGKVDNDCLVTPGWVNRLTEVHSNVREAGAIACCIFGGAISTRVLPDGRSGLGAPIRSLCIHGCAVRVS